MILPPYSPGSPTELAALTRAVRELNAAAALTEVPGEAQLAAIARIDELTNELRTASRKQMVRAYRTQAGTDIPGIPSEIVVNRYNPSAPEMTVHVTSPGLVRANVRVGAVHQGPADSVHGGISALLLDSILGIAVRSAGHLSMTGTLSLRYLQRTPLNSDLQLEAEVLVIEGRKIHAKASINHEGAPTVTASTVFIKVAAS